jgi:hypothetical protein
LSACTCNGLRKEKGKQKEKKRKPNKKVIPANEIPFGT